jgi:acetyl-CoA carboxylase biotin carboxyl carrier protein
MDLKYLKKVMDIFDASTATEISLEEEGSKIKLSKKQNVVAAPAVAQAPIQQVAAPAPAPVQASAPAPSTPEVAENSGLHEITSPIVGTFYAAPSPDSAPFVKVGDKVDVGSPLCIVEAMKLMNEIESDAKGTVEKIMLSNTDPVEYGQVLFLIKPD